MRRWTNWAIYLALSFAIILSTGCSTTGKSIGAGALSGGVLGAGVGALADPGNAGENRFRNVVIGTAVGSAVGAGTGFMADQYAKNEKVDAYEKGKKDAEEAVNARLKSSQSKQPRLLPAKTEAHWVNDSIRSNVFIPGHFEYQIIEPARWTTE